MEPHLAAALDHLRKGADELEQAFLQAGPQSPYMSQAFRVDAIVREIAALVVEGKA
jgi:hypothetical protein